MDHVCVLLIKGINWRQHLSLDRGLEIRWIQTNRTVLISLVMNEASLSQSHTNFNLSAAVRKARGPQNNGVKKRNSKYTSYCVPIVSCFKVIYNNVLTAGLHKLRDSQVPIGFGKESFIWQLNLCDIDFFPTQDLLFKKMI